MAILFKPYAISIWPFAAGIISLLGATQAAIAEQTLTFERDVAPILAAHCCSCHGATKQEGGLDLRRRFTMLRGGDGGPAITSGQPEKSLILEMIDDGFMPPDDEPPLSVKDAQLIRRWIAIGAPLAGSAEAPLNEADEPAAMDSARRHWSFQPIPKTGAPDIPLVADHQWPATPIDAFILAKLEDRGWRPAEPATPSELIRRVTYDLTGMPPSPDEVAAFSEDPSPQAYARLVDRLLASPRYGERWGQHWLDVVRFAESEGFEYDRHLPEAWRYRDYVIDAINEDMPFDQFAIEQIAGDERAAHLDASHEPQRRRLLSAAILHRLGPVRRNAGNPDIALSRNEVLTERTNILGQAFLGLTIGCARCHNHKREPITQKDYYRLQAYLAATAEHNERLGPEADIRAWEKQAAAAEQKVKQLKQQLASATDASKPALERQLKLAASEIPPPPPTIPTIRNDFSNATRIHVLRRGDWERKGVAVAPRPLSALVPDEWPELPAEVADPRSQLAAWMVDGARPLSARVIANRLWQHHFGAGLVATPNDFGLHGGRPSHPELLDWLTHQLVAHQWRWKPIHRWIVLSSVYRQSSDTTLPEAELEDPDNRLLWRFPRRRLSAEELRDSMLAVAGRMSLQAGGASVMTPVDTELIDLLYKPEQWMVSTDREEHHRRSIYLIAKRNLRLPMMEVFDAPALQSSCPVRSTSTHAPQALELLNGRFSNEMAMAFAQRLRSECGDDSHRIVGRAFALVAGRPPSDVERKLSVAFLADQPLEEFALAMFNLNGFLYVR